MPAGRISSGKNLCSDAHYFTDVAPGYLMNIFLVFSKPFIAENGGLLHAVCIFFSPSMFLCFSDIFRMFDCFSRFQ